MHVLTGPCWAHVDKNMLRDGRPAVTVYTNSRIYVTTEVEFGPSTRIRTIPTPLWEGGPNVIVYSPFGLTITGPVDDERIHTHGVHCARLHRRAFEEAGYRLRGFTNR